MGPVYLFLLFFTVTTHIAKPYVDDDIECSDSNPCPRGYKCMYALDEADEGLCFSTSDTNEAEIDLGDDDLYDLDEEDDYDTEWKYSEYSDERDNETEALEKRSSQIVKNQEMAAEETKAYDSIADEDNEMFDVDVEDEKKEIFKDDIGEEIFRDYVGDEMFEDDVEDEMFKDDVGDEMFEDNVGDEMPEDKDNHSELQDNSSVRDTIPPHLVPQNVTSLDNSSKTSETNKKMKETVPSPQSTTPPDHKNPPHLDNSIPTTPVDSNEQASNGTLLGPAPDTYDHLSPAVLATIGGAIPPRNLPQRSIMDSTASSSEENAPLHDNSGSSELPSQTTQDTATQNHASSLKEPLPIVHASHDTHQETSVQNSHQEKSTGALLGPAPDTYDHLSPAVLATIGGAIPPRNPLRGRVINSTASSRKEIAPLQDNSGSSELPSQTTQSTATQNHASSLKEPLPIAHASHNTHQEKSASYKDEAKAQTDKLKSAMKKEGFGITELKQYSTCSDVWWTNLTAGIPIPKDSPEYDHLKNKTELIATKIIMCALCSSSITNKAWLAETMKKVLNGEFTNLKLKEFALEALQNSIVKQTGDHNQYVSCRQTQVRLIQNIKSTGYKFNELHYSKSALLKYLTTAQIEEIHSDIKKQCSIFEKFSDKPYPCNELWQMYLIGSPTAPTERANLEKQIKITVMNIIKLFTCSSSVTNKVWFAETLKKVINEEFGSSTELKVYALEALNNSILRQTGHNRHYILCRKSLPVLLEQIRSTRFKFNSLHQSKSPLLKYRSDKEIGELQSAVKKHCSVYHKIANKLYSCTHLWNMYLTGTLEAHLEHGKLVDKIKLLALRIIKRSICSNSITSKVWFAETMKKIMNEELDKDQLKYYSIQAQHQSILKQTGHGPKYTLCRQRLADKFDLNLIFKKAPHNSTKRPLNHNYRSPTLKNLANIKDDKMYYEIKQICGAHFKISGRMLDHFRLYQLLHSNDLRAPLVCSKLESDIKIWVENVANLAIKPRTVTNENWLRNIVRKFIFEGISRNQIQDLAKQTFTTGMLKSTQQHQPPLEPSKKSNKTSHNFQSPILKKLSKAEVLKLYNETVHICNTYSKITSKPLDHFNLWRMYLVGDQRAPLIRSMLETKIKNWVENAINLAVNPFFIANQTWLVNTARRFIFENFSTNRVQDLAKQALKSGTLKPLHNSSKKSSKTDHNYQSPILTRLTKSEVDRLYNEILHISYAYCKVTGNTSDHFNLWRMYLSGDQKALNTRSEYEDVIKNYVKHVANLAIKPHNVTNQAWLMNISRQFIFEGITTFEIQDLAKKAIKTATLKSTQQHQASPESSKKPKTTTHNFQSPMLKKLSKVEVDQLYYEIIHTCNAYSKITGKKNDHFSLWRMYVKGDQNAPIMRSKYDRQIRTWVENVVRSAIPHIFSNQIWLLDDALVKFVFEGYSFKQIQDLAQQAFKTGVPTPSQESSNKNAKKTDYQRLLNLTKAGVDQLYFDIIHICNAYAKITGKIWDHFYLWKMYLAGDQRAPLTRSKLEKDIKIWVENVVNIAIMPHTVTNRTWLMGAVKKFVFEGYSIRLIEKFAKQEIKIGMQNSSHIHNQSSHESPNKSKKINHNYKSALLKNLTKAEVDNLYIEVIHVCYAYCKTTGKAWDHFRLWDMYLTGDHRVLQLRYQFEMNIKTWVENVVNLAIKPYTVTNYTWLMNIGMKFVFSGFSTKQIQDMARQTFKPETPPLKVNMKRHPVSITPTPTTSGAVYSTSTEASIKRPSPTGSAILSSVRPVKKSEVIPPHRQPMINRRNISDYHKRPLYDRRRPPYGFKLPQPLKESTKFGSLSSASVLSDASGTKEVPSKALIVIQTALSRSPRYANYSFRGFSTKQIQDLVRRTFELKTLPLKVNTKRHPVSITPTPTTLGAVYLTLTEASIKRPSPTGSATLSSGRPVKKFEVIPPHRQPMINRRNISDYHKRPLYDRRRPPYGFKPPQPQRELTKFGSLSSTSVLPDASGTKEVPSKALIVIQTALSRLPKYANYFSYGWHNHYNRGHYPRPVTYYQIQPIITSTQNAIKQNEKNKIQATVQNVATTTSLMLWKADYSLKVNKTSINNEHCKVKKQSTELKQPVEKGKRGLGNKDIYFKTKNRKLSSNSNIQPERNLKYYKGKKEKQYLLTDAKKTAKQTCKHLKRTRDIMRMASNKLINKYEKIPLNKPGIWLKHHEQKILEDCNTYQCTNGKMECTGQMNCKNITQGHNFGVLNELKPAKNNIADDPCDKCEDKKIEVHGENGNSSNSFCQAVNQIEKFLPSAEPLKKDCLDTKLAENGNISLEFKVMDSNHEQQCTSELVQLVNKPAKTLINSNNISKMGGAAKRKENGNFLQDTVQKTEEKKVAKLQELSSEMSLSGSLHVRSIVTVVTAVTITTIAVAYYTHCVWPHHVLATH